MQEKDRLAWIGGTFTERLQQDGYLETILAASGGKPPVWRNLGWSGDSPSGIARAVFGSQEDGFQRLIHDVMLIKPTVLVLSYGHAEAFDGPKGVAKFQQDLTRLVEEVQKRSEAAGAGKPRVIYLFPPPRLALGPGAAGAEVYNKNLALYRAAAKEFCEKQGATFISTGPLFYPDVLKHFDDDFLDAISHDGLNYESLGQWFFADMFFRQELSANNLEWSLEIDVASKKASGKGTTATIVMASNLELSVEVADKSLPFPPPPKLQHPLAYSLHGATLKVSGLDKGDYSIRVGDSPKTIHVAAEELAKGVQFNRETHLSQIEELRATINKKNELFFHRHRPQNETYLFLFRKHEQGNNAVEIPQFDPLIAKEEEKIAELVKPKPYKIVITRDK